MKFWHRIRPGFRNFTDRVLNNAPPSTLDEVIDNDDIEVIDNDDAKVVAKTP